MSARSRPFDLSPLARADYTNVLLYALQRWGERQMEMYDALLEQALTTLAANPNIGRARGDLGLGIRSHHVRQHIISYRTENNRVRVERILHQRMDAPHLFSDT